VLVHSQQFPALIIAEILVAGEKSGGEAPGALNELVSV
jgi:hypothetical protein